MAQKLSPFSQAVEEFVTRPTKKKKCFAQRMWEKKSIVGPEDVHNALLDFQNEKSQRASRKVLRPVFNALQDYDKVLDALVSADPMPSAFIWGGLKAIIACFQRYNELFEKLESQMAKLAFEMRRLKDYEELFRSSAEMQGLLVYSYLNILEFWVRVERECDTCGFMLAVKSLTSFSTRKLDEILAEMTTSNDQINKLIPVVQEKHRRSEYEDVKNEWQNAIFELERIALRQKVSQERQKKDRAEHWIGRDESGTNNGHHRSSLRDLEPGTGEWLFRDPVYNRWLDPASASRILWLNGGPAVGKSVICAHAANRLTQVTTRSVAFHYFRFDEPDVSPLAIYRNIACSLFNSTYTGSEEISDMVCNKAEGDLDAQSMRNLIEVLVAELSSTYIFLDGIDEECSNDQRWKTASQVLKFFIDLAQRPGSTLKLWCSSQDLDRVRALLAAADHITLGASINNDDIERFCKASLQRDFGDIDDITKSRLLERVKTQVDGNFLWVKLMLPALSSAVSVVEMEQHLQQGLPLDFMSYIEKQIRSTNKAQHGILSKVLACVVYAKRPLQLSELCEAIQIMSSADGQDMSPDACVRQDRLIATCESLVKFDNIQTSQGVMRQICTLWHSSFKTFLENNPNVLGHLQYAISQHALAMSCLNYLWQPRYDGLLSKVGPSFSTVSDEDIRDHHLLVYCAKYWRSHMDSLPYSLELCQKIESFVRSPNFITCLQVQSLWVDKWFSFWYSLGDIESGRHLVRVFPRWFSEEHSCGAVLHRQYNTAIGEWGYFLNEQSFYKGPHRGNLGLCLWSSLGKSNFLSKIPSDYKSFVFEKSGTQLDDDGSLLLERVDNSGTQMELFKLDVQKDGIATVICERWTIASGRSPKLSTTQTLQLTSEQLKSCLDQANSRRPGQAPVMTVSDCGQTLRVGSQAYTRSSGELEAVTGFLDELAYFEELSSNDAFFAVACRHKASAKEVEPELQPLAAEPPGPCQSEVKASPDDSSTSDSDSGSDSGSDSKSDSDFSTLRKTRDGGQDNDGTSPETALGVVESSQLALSDSDSFRTSSSLSSLSARASTSQGSTEAGSEEIKDDTFMNDFASDSDPRELEIDEDMVSEDDWGSLDNAINDHDGHLRDDSSLGSARFPSPSPEPDDGTSTDNASNCQYMEGGTGSSHSSDGDESGSEDDGGGTSLNELLEPRTRQERKGTRCEVQIFRKPEASSSPHRVFRFFQPSSSPLFASPPAFHPTVPLVVWPLSDGELLFADYANNTYFIRRMRSGYRSSCQISVQCQFSACGSYLHIASLDGFIYQAQDDQRSLGLRLHVSTHCLSRRKTTRSPPRLIYRTSLGLPAAYTQAVQLSVSNLPYTLTWVDSHVFVTRSQTPLKVYRLPLFQNVEDSEKTESSPRAVFTNTTDVYLPASVETRRVFFFPVSDSHTKIKTRSAGVKDKRKETYVATVIIGAQNQSVTKAASEEGETVSIECGRTLPQGVHLTAAQFGKWEGVDPHSGDSNIERLARAETWRGGQLDAKFEKFDRSEDCDIVPYLGF